jgi:hypothetical protein
MPRIETVTPPLAPYRLLTNGVCLVSGLTQSTARRLLAQKVFGYLLDGYTVQSADLGFARLWRHSPAEMIELEIREVD